MALEVSLTASVSVPVQRLQRLMMPALSRWIWVSIRPAQANFPPASWWGASQTARCDCRDAACLEGDVGRFGQAGYTGITDDEIDRHGASSDRQKKIAGDAVVIGNQRLDIGTLRHAVGNAPFACDHDAIGRGGAAKHEGCQRITGTGETQFV